MQGPQNTQWNLSEQKNALVTKVIDTFVRELKTYVQMRLANRNLSHLLSNSRFPREARRETEGFIRQTREGCHIQLREISCPSADSIKSID